MKIKGIFLGFALLLAANMQAQTIARKSISSAGGTLTGGGNMITFNIGETMIPTLSGGGSILTQGFEQPGEQIRTGSVVTSLCAGMPISVPFTAIDIVAGNTFTAQLSNASGSFSAPVTIGTLAGYASGTINATIPVGTTAGTGYRIRVVSDKPVALGMNNGVNIAILKPAPVAKCRTAVVVLSSAGNGSISPAGINNGSTDGGCGSTLNLSLSKSTFNCSNLGPNIVTLTVTNVAGISSSCTATVTVKDLTRPTARCKAASYSVGTGGTVVVPPSAINDGSTDACTSPPNLNLSPNTFTCANLGANSVTLYATDGSNNTGTCVTTVTITCIGTAPQKAPDATAFADLVELMDLFPNPAANEVNVRLSRRTSEELPLTITDYTGKLVYRGLFAKGTSQLTVDLQRQGMASGLYLVSVRFADKVQTKPLVVFRD